jgi:phosphatidylinositol 4-kinase B
LNENDNISRPFLILTNLWAHKNVIKELEQTRLNPNLISINQVRNDLEFYIPQLCTFLIFGDYEAVEEFLAFLCKACYASFFFAHRIIWFLKSLQLQENLAMNDK